MNRHTRKTYARRGALTLLVLILLAMLSLLSVPLFAQPPAEGAMGSYPLPSVVGMSSAPCPTPDVPHLLCALVALAWFAIGFAFGRSARPVLTITSSDLQCGRGVMDHCWRAGDALCACREQYLDLANPPWRGGPASRTATAHERMRAPMITIEMTVRLDDTHRDCALIRASVQAMFTGIMARAGCDGGSLVVRGARPFHRLPDGWEHVDPMPGKYWKDKDGSWYAWTPNGILAGLSKHQVTEHEDGSITVSPSVRSWDTTKSYHGFFERGRWRDA